MSSPSPALMPPSNGDSKSKWDVVEQLIKIGTGLLALFYAAGFLVVSVHHGRYGIVMFEFLRARVFAAGILLSFFVGLPPATTLCARLAFERMKGGKGFRRWAVAGGVFFWVAVVWIFVLTPWMSGIVQPHVVTWWISPVRPPLPGFAVWFFIFAAVGGLFPRLYRTARSHADDWILVCLVGVFAIVSFAAFIYGRVIPAWGGGLPTPVTIHLSEKVAFTNSTDAPAYLVDETERGYYLIHKLDDHNASFIPREAVSSIDFEEIR